ncbi:MAG: HPF/RaiA family ribosome-associated protein, partial [Deltaproteobacteria bacterium]|nr:HPF/RaiA family ribosome-associated protein [Deltaproteobacteria bacterium]
MNVVIHKNGVKISELAEKLIERKVKKLDQMLEHFNPDLVSLRLELNDIPRKGLFSARTVLALPGTTLRAEKEGKDLITVLGETFDSLLREVKKYKEFLRREPEYRRKRPDFKEKMMQVSLPEEIEEAYLEMVDRNMGRLYNFA